MLEVRRTDVFSRWLDQLRDDRAIARILTRIYRLSLGNFGDAKPVGGGVSELRLRARLSHLLRAHRLVGCLIACRWDKENSAEGHYPRQNNDEGG